MWPCMEEEFPQGMNPWPWNDAHRGGSSRRGLSRTGKKQEDTEIRWELQGEAPHPSSAPEEGRIDSRGQHRQAQEAALPILGMGIPAEPDTGNAATLQC